MDELERTQNNSIFADEKNLLFAIETKEHTLSSLRYIELPKNRAKYDKSELQHIETKIHLAAERFGIPTNASKSIKFSFFTNLAKGYDDEDGNHYIIGESSGPEKDAENERMGKSALECMLKSIKDKVVNDNGELVPVSLNDAHKHDGVEHELGEIVDAELNDQLHLVVKAKLDMDNGASQTLLKKLNKNKAFGLSVGGVINRIEKSWDEESQSHVRTFTDVSLEEISITARPSWSPSFGTVMAKSAKEYIISNEESSEEEPKLPMKTEDKSLPESTEAVETQKSNDSVQETIESTDPVIAEGESVEKAKKGSVKKVHYAIMAKKAGHMQNHLNDMASGQSHPADELQHLVSHAKDFVKSMTSLANDDPSCLDDEMSENDNPTPFYLSEKPDMTDETKVTKTETPEVKEDVVETKVEETKVEKQETAKSEVPDFASLIKSAVEEATAPLLKEINSLKEDIEVVKNAPVGGPKGVIKAETTVDTSRVIEKSEEQDTPETRQARIDKAIADNPELPMKKILEIFYGLDKQ